MQAAALIEHGFEVRLFDRSPGPGGNWYYSSKPPLPIKFSSVNVLWGDNYEKL